MKKILVLTNIITGALLCVTLFTACPTKPTPRDTAYTCTPCPNVEGFDDIQNGLQTDYVKALISNYRKNHWNTISSNPAFTGLPTNTVDSRSVWFSLEKLKAFITHIEKQTDLYSTECKGDHCDKNLGIRIYFGEYGGAALPNNRIYDGLHTLVMVPTFQNTSALGTPNENVDFDPKYNMACGGVTSGLDTNAATITALMPTIRLDMLNHGDLVPPPSGLSSAACTGARLMHMVDYLDATAGTITGIPINSTCPF